VIRSPDVANAYLAAESGEAGRSHVRGIRRCDDATAIRNFCVAYLRSEQDLDLRALRSKFRRVFAGILLYTKVKWRNMSASLLPAAIRMSRAMRYGYALKDFGDDKTE